MFIDSHTHLDHIDREAADLVVEAAEAGVGIIIQSGTNLESSRHAVALAERYPQVFCSVGFHPQEAGLLAGDDLSALEELAVHERVVAVGETGFDFYRDRWPHDLQEEVFVRHLELACRLGLPVVIHTRDAERHTLAVLAEHARGLTVVLHCFSLAAHLDEVLERGYYLSFAGNVTFKNASDLQWAARVTPAAHLLLETDAPYLTPVPYRGHPNRPALVAKTYEFVAGLRGVGVEELAMQVEANVRRAFPRIGATEEGRGR
ncbi:MAG: TatD family hydrolase [Thermoleophilia bacterium]|jgi:TatD DNase family protein